VDTLLVRVGHAIARVKTTASVLARVDCVGALADLAHREGYVRPESTTLSHRARRKPRIPVDRAHDGARAFIPMTCY